VPDAQIAADLHTLLHRGHVPGPYVLAGHSFGGLYVLAFAAHYPTRSPEWSWWTPPHRPRHRRQRGPAIKARTSSSIASAHWPRSPLGWA
jgi:alpha-beta hydrolase superfamily lysophospholipase